MKIPLGSKVKDNVTGLTGIVTGRTEYINGCVQYIVKPPMGKNGKVPDAEYVDEEQLSILGKGVSVKTTPSGGPQSDRPSADYRG